MSNNSIKLPVTVFGASLIFCSSVGVAHALEAGKTPSMRPGFQLGNRDVRTVANYKVEKSLRICVAEQKPPIAVKVLYDGNEKILSGGNCADIVAKNVRLAPAEKLPRNFTLKGNFNRLQK